MEYGKLQELDHENRQSMNRRNYKWSNEEIMRGNQCWMQDILTERRESGGQRRERKKSQRGSVLIQYSWPLNQQAHARTGFFHPVRILTLAKYTCFAFILIIQHLSHQQMRLCHLLPVECLCRKEETGKK